MREQYDFSKGKRGKFYNPDAMHQLPVYLEGEVFDYFAEKARLKGVEVNIIVNDLLKKDIDLIEGIT